ncbi:hypothetical protein NDU88_003174 [Pleurodeles waltl]|uniref:Uncharacterized protein n=1 Tax=Pleurodeles waltl TaxID=8319 RepID=A0AAV7W1E0_PLEWA|nr:hypothetical protein NDU88_003174 [Pleurodeles waltl]
MLLFAERRALLGSRPNGTHYAGRKEVRRDVEHSPTDRIVTTEAPGGESDAGPVRHWEEEQGSEENGEESLREQTKNPAPPQVKNTTK